MLGDELKYEEAVFPIIFYSPLYLGQYITFAKTAFHTARMILLSVPFRFPVAVKTDKEMKYCFIESLRFIIITQSLQT